jgi:hypothetical protein
MRKGIAVLMIGISSLAWSNFTLSGGVIKDLNTQLEWQNNFDRNIPELSWNEAVNYCEKLSLQGDNWRIPNKEELVSIIKKDTTEPALDTVFLNKEVTNFTYWTSTVAEDKDTLKWGVSFQKGWIGRYSQNYSLKVRCVRGNLAPKLIMAETFDPTAESKPFQEEKEGIILILGDPTPIKVKN